MIAHSETMLFCIPLFVILWGSGAESASTSGCFHFCTCISYFNYSRNFVNVDCRDRGISKVPNIAAKYPNTVNLDLSSNSIDVLARGEFSDLPYLQKVLLNSNFLEYVSKDAFNSSQSLNSPVLYVDLSDNHIHEVPPCFQHLDEYSTRLHNLTDLLLAGNELGPVILSHSFSATRYMENLDLSRNRISRIEERTLRYLPHLRQVSLQFNQIESISSNVFGRSTPLVSLRLTRNRLSSIPAGMPSTLRLLELGENRIANITINDVRSLHELPNIITLNISSNGLRSVAPGAFLAMSKLLTLDLSNNHIFSLQSDVFAGAISLEYLFLNRNPYMQQLPKDIFTGLPNLKFLFLYGCSLKTLSIGSPSISPHSFSFSSSVNSETVEVDPYIAPQLKALWLFANPINCNCQILPLIWFLNRRNVSLDLDIDNFSRVFDDDVVIRTHLQYSGTNGGVIPVTSTVCTTPFNRHDRVVGEKLLSVPESYLICPDQPFFVVVSMFLGIILFAAAIPVVFFMVLLYLCTVRVLFKHLGISLREEED